VRSKYHSSDRARLTGGAKRGAASDQGGLGFKFRRLRTGLFQITALKRGGSAERCGQVVVGDTLLAVDGQSTHGLASPQLADLVLGRTRTWCRLDLQRADEILQVFVATRPDALVLPMRVKLLSSKRAPVRGMMLNLTSVSMILNPHPAPAPAPTST
jgi:C-terminal processing protease CtpA/Prc